MAAGGSRDLYQGRKTEFERLRTTIYGLIAATLTSEGINFLHCQTRIKSPESASEKYRKNDYKSLDELTDAVGARIIVYLESDIERAENAMQALFEIDEENSIDRLRLKPREIGYRSLHLICSLGDRRRDFIEYRGLCEIKFEIQIRTALQHAWAEIEHQQNYKSRDTLPPDLERRLTLLSGNIEGLDRELSEIVNLARNYEQMVEKEIPSVENDRLSGAALLGIYRWAIPKFRLRRYEINYTRTDMGDLSLIARECGFERVRDMRGAVRNLEKEKLQALAKVATKLDAGRLIKFALIRNNLDAYLSAITARGTFILHENMAKFYDTHFPNLNIRSIAQKHGIPIEPDFNAE